MNKVKIKVYEKSYKFINYLIYNEIYYERLESFNDYYILIVSYDDYIKIRRRYKCNIIQRYGVSGIKYYVMFHKYMFISLLFCAFILILLSNTIFEVRINSDDKYISSLLISELKSNNIYKYKRKKSFNEIIEIKKRILESNKDFLEWIEISDKGSIYIVDVTPKIKNDKEVEKHPSSIYSKYNGVIKYYSVKRGNRIVELNDYVKKGDLLISGNIVKDDVVVDKVCAMGEVYAEVWYTTSVSIPFKYIKKEKTGKTINHYYLDVFNHKFSLIGKYDNNDLEVKKELVLSKAYLPFDLYREVKTEYKNVEYNLTNEEAYNLGLEKSDEKINNMLLNDEYIISKKVLKKRVNRSKMLLEVFYKIYRNIGYTSNIDILGEKDELSNKGSN